MFLRDGVRIVVIAAVVVALISFLAGMPLSRLAAAGWSHLATPSRRRWVGRHRNPLMLVAGGLGGLALLVRDAPGAGYVLTVLVLSGLVIAAIAAIGSPRGDPDAEELACR